METKTQLKLYLVMLLIYCPGILWAKNVPVETARKVAVNSMNKSNQAKDLSRGQNGASKKLTLAEAAHIYTAKKKDISVYYVFNFSPEGWIIISADDAACPVIGYGDTGLYDPNVLNQPPAFIEWMDNAASQIADAASKNLNSRPKDASDWQQLSVEPDNYEAGLDGSITIQAVSPLIKSRWGQGEGHYLCPWCDNRDGWPWDYQGYNNYCPWVYWGDLHLYRDYCPTGCTATAMAQIMKYWQWPPFGKGSHGYTTPRSYPDSSGFGWRYMNFASQHYDWSDSSMPLNPIQPSDAIARVMRDIGIAVDMNYTPEGSGASGEDAATAFHSYFRYNSVYNDHRDWYSDSEWIGKVKTDLNFFRPVWYEGYNSDWSSGHAFVCDGYDDSNNFHFNWGWTEHYDGWFTLNSLTPGSHNYSYHQGAIFNLEPEPVSIMYVDDDYTSSNCGGHQWGIDAFNKIQNAVNPPTMSEGIIYVAAGTYYESIDLKGKAIHLYAVSGPAFTTINANGADHAIQCITGEDANTIIEGFTITGGNANGSSPHNCGGGMLNYYSSPTVINCRFISNTASLHGGGMHNEWSSPTVISCTFSQNHAGTHGGGLMDNWNPGYSNIINCLFTSNTAGNGGGGYCSSAGLSRIYNCTLSGNSASQGGGIYSWYGGTHLYNCIVWGNSPTEIVYDTYVVTAEYSDIKGGYPGTGNINSDPCFLSDFTLTSASLCRDAGNNDWLPADITKDLAGLPRFIDGDCDSNSIVDIGAYEFSYAPIGDFDYDCSIDFTDLAVIAVAWLSEPPDPKWNPIVDISVPADNSIDSLDLNVFVNHWLEGL